MVFFFAFLREEIFLWSWVGLWALLWKGYIVLYLYLTWCHIPLIWDWTLPESKVWIWCLHPSTASREKHAYIIISPAFHSTQEFANSFSVWCKAIGYDMHSDECWTYILQRSAFMLLMDDFVTRLSQKAQLWKERSGYWFLGSHR